MSSILRLATRSALRARQFSTTTVARKDLVQDLYVNQLKAYKPAPAAQDAHVGAVKSFSTPAAPQPPSVPSDLASELSAYDAAEPTKDAAPVAAAAGGAHDAPGAGAEAFLSFLEADEPKAEHH